MLTRVDIKRFKCLRDVGVDLGPFNVLIGPNDAGKSLFLQALGEPQRAVTGGVVHLAQMAALKPSVRLRSDRAELWVTAGPAGLVLGAGSHGQEAATVRASPLWKKIRDKPFLRVSDPLALEPAAVAAPSPRGSGALPRLIETRGRGAAAHLARVALGERKHYDAIQRGLHDLTEGRVREAAVGEDAGEGYPLFFRLHDDSVLPAGDVAQGLLVFFALLCIVHRDDLPAVLLVEGPENGVHPLALPTIVRLLRGLVERGVQILVTTCSPGLLDLFGPAEVLVFRRPRPDAWTEVHRLPADFARRARGAKMGDVWSSEGEEGLLDLAAPTNRRGQAAG